MGRTAAIGDVLVECGAEASQEAPGKWTDIGNNVSRAGKKGQERDKESVDLLLKERSSVTSYTSRMPMAPR